jgi:hypothetical protein
MGGGLRNLFAQSADEVRVQCSKRQSTAATGRNAQQIGSSILKDG